MVNSSGRRNTSRRCCDGGKQAPRSGSSPTSTDAFTRPSAGGTPRASAEVLGRDRSRSVEREGRRGRGCVPRCRDTLVPRMWWHVTPQALSPVRALSLIRRARRDRHSSSPWSWRARDRPAAGPRTLDDLARAAAERSDTRREPRVSSHDRSMARRTASETSQACEARYERRTEAVCTGSPRRPDPDSRWYGRARPRCALDWTAPRSPTRPAVGSLVES